jgi:predicted esterase
MSSHEGQPLLHAGPELSLARAAMIMLHGRGAGAADILGLASQFPYADLAFLAPQADQNSWYPYSFLVPEQQNRPGLDSAMRVISSLILESELQMIPRERIFLLGFSQGGCLALEFAARHPARYGGVFGLSGGLFGPPGTTWEYEGSLENTPVFIGCSDVDPHVPQSRVEETAEALRRIGGDVDLRIYPGMGHTVSADEIEAINSVISGSLAS